MSNLADPWVGGKLITPSNSNLKRTGSGLYVWEAGDLEFMTMEGDILGPYAVVAGQIIPFRVKQVRTGTTAVVSVGYSS